MLYVVGKPDGTRRRHHTVYRYMELLAEYPAGARTSKKFNGIMLVYLLSNSSTNANDSELIGPS